MKKTLSKCLGIAAVVLLLVFALAPIVTAQSAWRNETVDSDGVVGRDTSIALDSNAYPHISYYDSTNSDLKYAKWTGSAWSKETVDSDGDVGRYTSIALDANDNPHISYLDLTNNDLKYAKWTGSAWSKETVDSCGALYQYGSSISIALDTNGYPHISYFDAEYYDLKYAKWTGSTWSKETVDSAVGIGYTSIALDTNDYPHISYLDGANGVLKYAKWTGSTWSKETVDSAEDVGCYTSIALDTNDYPHISYFNYMYNYDLKYAKWTGSAWNKETVDSAGWVGWFTSIALDSDDHPHISYYDLTNGDLKYAKWTGSTWSKEPVDSAKVCSTSIALDTNDYPHISYFDTTNDDLKYATLAEPADADIELTVYIEDAAGASAIVNKAPGDVVDIVAVVENKETSTQTVNVELSVPPELGYPEGMVIIREDFSPLSKIRDNLPVLSVPLDLEPGTVQVVWRFRISDSISPQVTNVHAEAKVDGRSCATGVGGFHIVNNVNAIIVTNRYLLFKKYGCPASGSSNVENLLSYLYKVGADENCIVYYVDHYDNDLEGWNQVVDYSGGEYKANEKANTIDDLIDEWAEELKQTGEYPYLMIVGGDEVIPFYRAKDPKLDVPFYKDVEKDCAYNSDDPVKNTTDHNYILTDATYADVGPSFIENWMFGEVELIVGRIVGCSAEDMEDLIRRGISGPSENENAIVASIKPGWRITDVVAKLRDTELDMNILNDDESPTTIESSEWTKNALISAMNAGFSIFAIEAHGDYYCIETPLPFSDKIICTNEYWNVNYNPFMFFMSCHVGLVTDESNDQDTGAAWDPFYRDCMLYLLVHNGASGVIAPTGATYATSLNDVAWGEKLINNFFNELINDDGKIQYSVGRALKEGKENWGEIVYSGTDKKTLIEFLLYGVPWMEIKNPQGNQGPSSTTSSANAASFADNGFVINISEPHYISAGTYSRVIEVKINDYTTAQIDGFDLVEIPGAEMSYDDLKPVLPELSILLKLPADAQNIAGVIVEATSTQIGDYNIPSYIPTIEGGEYSDYTDVVGFYPTPMYSINAINSETYTKTFFGIIPIQYNPQTNETILYNYTKLELTYQTQTTAAITDFSPTKTEYSCGEPITTSVTIENVGADALTGLQANLSLKDLYGQVKASELSLAFDVASGESNTISVGLDQSLPHGSYLTELNLINSTGDVLGSTSEHIYISTGGIAVFSLASEVVSGEDITFNITFENGNTTSVEATGVVYIYDPQDIEIAQLPSLPVMVAPDSEELISITWSTVGKKLGAYKAAAYVFTNGETFGPEYGAFEIKSIPKSDLVITETWVCWSDNCTICYNLTNIGNGIAPAGHNTTLYVDGDEKAHDEVPVDLASDESYTGCFDDYNWDYTPPDDNITACADCNNTVAESNETNNCMINTWKCGDVDGNGIVNILDVRLLANHVNDPTGYPVDPWAGNVDGEGDIDGDDVQLLLAHVFDSEAHPLNCRGD